MHFCHKNCTLLRKLSLDLYYVSIRVRSAQEKPGKGRVKDIFKIFGLGTGHVFCLFTLVQYFPTAPLQEISAIFQFQ